MTDPSAEACTRFLEDPEGNAAHLQICAECRAVNAALAAKAEVPPPAIDIDALPLAPWEGSSYRPWPLILGLAGVVTTIALALCSAAGISPSGAAESSMGSIEASWAMLRRASTSLRGASVPAQIAFGAAVVIVNALLVVLLRRAPRGIDA
jgi:hypothetical protein